MVTSSGPNTSLANVTITLTLFILPIIYLSHKQRRLARERQEERSFLLSLSNPTSPPLRPPLPPIVRRVLSRCRFAYLSTIDVDANSSHLSLMRFTYLPEEEIIVMSTNRKTKKYDILEKQSGVSLLVHDFSEGDSRELTGEYSITLNGNCSVIRDVESAERYRAAHLRNNPDYPQFIIGDDIAILRVDVHSARICNINDQVIKWNVNDRSKS
ncbi:hypothetical protein ACHAXS_002818 [Conticribra weissflogii]